MDIERYMDIMKWVIKNQIEYAREESNEGKFASEYMEGYYGGIVRGLEIALEKIEASKFLAEKK
jgi:RNA binding exosome subunit